jgi:mono/diheme cytochrome c family protein
MSFRSLVLIPLLITVVMVLLALRVIYHPADNNPGGPMSMPSEPPQTTAETAHPMLIANPSEQPELADAPGKDAFLANCLNCHTARYVTMQPRFGRKVWQAEVTKMVAAYKAPVPPDQQAQIVNYLVAGYGTEAK